MERNLLEKLKTKIIRKRTLEIILEQRLQENSKGRNRKFWKIREN